MCRIPSETYSKLCLMEKKLRENFETFLEDFAFRVLFLPVKNVSSLLLIYSVATSLSLYIASQPHNLLWFFGYFGTNVLVRRGIQLFCVFSDPTFFFTSPAFSSTLPRKLFPPFQSSILNFLRNCFWRLFQNFDFTQYMDSDRQKSRFQIVLDIGSFRRLENSSFDTFVHLLSEVFFSNFTLFLNGMLKNGKRPHQRATGNKSN